MQFAAGDSVFMTDNSGTGASTKTGLQAGHTDIESVVNNNYTSMFGTVATSGKGAFDNIEIYSKQ